MEKLVKRQQYDELDTFDYILFVADVVEHQLNNMQRIVEELLNNNS